LNYVTSRSAANYTAERISALGRRVWIVKADISEQDDVEAMMEFIADEIGQLDIVVSNAASGGFRPLLESNADQFHATMNTNVLALIMLVKAALPLLEQS